MSMNFIKWLLLTAIALVSLPFIEANAQNSITLYNVEASDASYPYMSSYYVDGEVNPEIMWNGNISFEASGYELPLQVSVTETSGTGYSVSEVIAEEPFVVDNLIPGNYVIQVVDQVGNNGTYEDGISVGIGNCEEALYLRNELPNVNMARVYLFDVAADSTDNDALKYYALDSVTYQVMSLMSEGNAYTYTGVYGEIDLDLSQATDLEYGVYEVLAVAYYKTCSWEVRFEMQYEDPCANFYAELISVEPASIYNNGGSALINVGTMYDYSFAELRTVEGDYYVGSFGSEGSDIYLTDLSEDEYYAVVTDNVCNDTVYFDVERNCEFMVNVTRLTDSNDTLTLMPNMMFAQSYIIEEYDTVPLDAYYTWNDGFYGPYMEYYYEDTMYTLTADYEGCSQTIEGYYDSYNEGLYSCDYPFAEYGTTDPSISNNNGSITNVGLDDASDLYPYWIYVFTDNGDYIGGHMMESDSDMEYEFANLATGGYRMYAYKEWGNDDGACVSLNYVNLYADCETFELTTELVENDTAGHDAIYARVFDNRTNQSFVSENIEYEWDVNGETYYGSVLYAEEFIEIGLIEYNYFLTANVNGCQQFYEGSYTFSNDCNMSAEIVEITPYNTADPMTEYAVVTVLVTNGTAPYVVNNDGESLDGMIYESDIFEIYIYPTSDLEALPYYIIDSWGCVYELPEFEIPTCSMTTEVVYGEDRNVSISISAEGTDYYPVYIYSRNYGDLLIGETQTSEFAIPEEYVSAWDSYLVVASNGCQSEVYLEEEEICSLSIANVTKVNPSSSEIENGSITIDVAGGEAPYYVSYTKIFDTYQLDYYFVTNNSPVVISNLSAGDYVFAVADRFGCMVDAMEYYGEDNAVVSLLSQCALRVETEVTDDGVSFDMIDGTSPYTAVSETGQAYTTDESSFMIPASEITAGTHFYTITDARGCTQSVSVEVISDDCENVNIELEAQIENTTSATMPNGSITLAVSGGTEPYVFYWTNGYTTQSISGLYPGEYEVYVSDANGCMAHETYAIEYAQEENLFNELYIDVNYHIEVITVPTDNGPVEAPFAVAHVQAFEGEPPYSYSWNVPSTYSDQQALAVYESGAVCVNVTDAANNEVSGCLYIELPSADQISNDIVEEVAGVVDTCINSSAIASAQVTNVELIEGSSIYRVTWNLIEKNGPVHELVVDYPVDTLATGIYAFNLYLRCNGQRAVSSFSTRLYLTGSVESVEAFSLESTSINAYPNPFNEMLNVEINAVENDNVAINVYNVSGQMIYTTSAEVSNGANNIEIETSNYGAGVYFINVVGNSINETIKVVK